MLFDYKYSGTTTVSNSSQDTKMNFVPDLLRTPTFFSGKLHKKVAFREAISALHDVVVSDLRFKPQDKTAYKEWATEQEQLWLAEYIETYQIDQIRVKIEQLRKELADIQQEKEKVLAPFNKAQKKYFNYLYQKTGMPGTFSTRLLRFTRTNFSLNVLARMNLPMVN
ncbi:MAG: hypothetical protein LIP01_16085 [Tannerellaceae bacterium]|nr:hypothetical protein [Tannerellaceae bacterium]